MNNMDNPWNFHQSNLRCYKPRFLHRNLNHAKKHKTRSKNDPFICGFHPLENYQCEKCQFQFDCKVLLTKHFNTVHKTKSTEHYPINPVFKSCEQCNFQTYSSLVLLSHNSSCGGSRNTNLESLKDIKVKSVYDGLVCGTVQNVLTRWPDADIDKLLEHEEKKGHPQLNQDKIIRFECDRCSYKSIQKKCLKEHMRTMHPTFGEIDWFRCAYCPYKAERKPYLVKHMRNMHSTSEQITWFKCTHCSYKTKQKDNLHRHLFTQHPETLTLRPTKFKYFKCGQCSYKTTTHISNLKLHTQRMHTPPEQINWIKCEYCPYEANLKHNMFKHLLRRHRKVLDPQNVKYTKCKLCYATLLKYNLKLHMDRIHPCLES